MNNNLVRFEMDDSKSNVMVKYKNESISFSMTYYKKGKKNHDVQAAMSPFVEFNEWLATKPLDWHDKIFSIYRDIKEDINLTNNVEVLLGYLNKRFIELFSMVDLKEITDWIRRPNTPVYISVKNNINYDEKTTYGYEDYLKLVTFSLALRFVAPVWGDIHNRLNNVYKDSKEVYAMEILHGTQLVSDPSSGYHFEAEDRLREFIVNNKTKLETNAVLLSGLSEDDFYNYLYSVIVLKKISQGELSGHDGQYHLIAQTYFFLSNIIRQASKSYGSDTTQIQMKKNPTDDKSGNESNSQSVLDVGFVRSRLYTDEKVFLRMAVRDHKRLIETICPTLPEELYWESMDTIREMDTSLSHLSYSRQYMKPIQDVQITLAKWITHSSVNSVIYDHLELDEIITLIGLVRAILWYYDYQEFAAIISGIALPITADIPFMQSSYRKNIDSSLAEQLTKTYDLGGITKSEKRNMSYQGCIELINEQIAKYSWQLTLPEKWLAQSRLVQRDKILIIPSDIRNKIGQLMLFIESGQKISVPDEYGF